MARLHVVLLLLLSSLLAACKKTGTAVPEPPPLAATGTTVNGQGTGTTFQNAGLRPVVRFAFSAPVQAAAVGSHVSFTGSTGQPVPFGATLENKTVVVVQPLAPLEAFSSYTVSVAAGLPAESGGRLPVPVGVVLHTGLDSTSKFPVLSDSDLLDLVQRQTFRYFWDFAHPVSGLARERNTSGETVTTGGSGFGIMAVVAAVHRGFISRAEGLARLQQITDFLGSRADRFHGAFPHWLNGSTGRVVPFSAQDNGADLVETSYLMQGLLTARQYFNGAGAGETALRAAINALWQAVEWNWFRKGSENLLYWHWSPSGEWAMNHPVQGWNEALVTYVLAAASPQYAIPKSVYDAGWARNGALRNGQSYLGVPLPLGPAYGGPLFFAHYSFLGIDPRGLKDAYADYWEQNRNHTLIHYEYCRANPKGFAGYSDACWGLTASDDNKAGYLAHEPANDNGVIAPTAALSSFPYTPAESMKALKFYYYQLGDRLWKEYGFVDAFNLTDRWFADSFLAIDQGPIIVMIENHRSGLLWNLFMSCPEVKTGLRALGFTGPHL